MAFIGCGTRNDTNFATIRLTIPNATSIITKSAIPATAFCAVSPDTQFPPTTIPFNGANRKYPAARATTIPTREPSCPENPLNSPTTVKNAVTAKIIQSMTVSSTYSSFRYAS